MANSTILDKILLGQFNTIDINLILIIMGVVVAIVLLLIIIIIVKIRKVKKVNSMQLEKPVWPGKIGDQSQKDIKDAVGGNKPVASMASPKTEEMRSSKPVEEKGILKSRNSEEKVIISGEAGNYLDYNQKVRELLAEGNLSMDRKNLANAKVVYDKIKNWYDKNDDPNGDLYNKIMAFYNRIVNEGQVN